VLASVLTIWLTAHIGRLLLGAEAGWWGALRCALLPVPVFYGRTVQPEATLMLLAAPCLDRALAWRDRGRLLDLLLCWLGFTGCLLVKLLPVVWLGLPLLSIFSWGLSPVQRVLTHPLPFSLCVHCHLVRARLSAGPDQWAELRILGGESQGGESQSVQLDRSESPPATGQTCCCGWRCTTSP